VTTDTSPSKTEFDTHYAFLLKRVLAAKPEYNRRTKTYVRAIDGAFFRMSSFPILGLRDIRPLWSCAEAVWFLAGQNGVEFFHKWDMHSWDKFAGKLGEVESATGFRWRYGFGCDQLNVLLDKLRTDPSNRQGVLQTWHPDKDMVNPGPNAPCLTTWHFHIINGRLNVSVMQRSGDLYFGVPHDVLGCRLVQELLAAELGVPPGKVSYLVSNAHLYQDQWKAAEEMIFREEACDKRADYPIDLNLQTSHGTRALRGDASVVEEVHTRIRNFYRPFPAIKGPSLVK